MKLLRFTVGAADAGQRLDAVLAAHTDKLSRRRARELCSAGAVSVNGRPGRPGQALREGDGIEAQLPELLAARPELAAAQGGAQGLIGILYEDEHLLAVSKPRAMPSVVLRAGDPLTLADCVAEHCAACREASGDPREAGLVQRLDYYTSGVVLAAKSAAVWQALHQALLGGEIEKSYLALVEGRPDKTQFSIEASLVQIAGGTAMAVVEPGPGQETGRRSFEALTEAAVCESYFCSSCRGEVSLVRARAQRTRRHQIRAHLAAAGHPLVGDLQYGSRFDSVALPGKEESSVVEGFYLHAESVRLVHPITGNELNLE